MAVTTPRRFEVHTREDAGAVVVAVLGEIDMATAPALESALADALVRASAVTVDLDACDFMDSSGLHVLERAGGRGRLRVRCSRVGPAARALVLTGFPLHVAA
ncbi:MAG TPA: STAS domain-containing protein [Solirubrobacteraceae bacterium]|nr:STAS domain-containing protein [Solirubrobacteraceae bacterium]